MSFLHLALRPTAVVLLLLAFTSSPVRAAPSPPAANIVFAESITVHGFIRYWKGFVNRTDRVVLVVGLVAAAALFIITRGKWLK